MHMEIEKLQKVYLQIDNKYKIQIDIRQIVKMDQYWMIILNESIARFNYF